MAVGAGHVRGPIDDELDAVLQGAAQFKAVRGDYGSGKTFFSRWLTERAKKKNFATAEIQISETPPHKLEKVDRRIVEHLSTPGVAILPSVCEGWRRICGRSAALRSPRGCCTATTVVRRSRPRAPPRATACSARNACCCPSNAGVIAREATAARMRAKAGNPVACRYRRKSAEQVPGDEFTLPAGSDTLA